MANFKYRMLGASLMATLLAVMSHSALATTLFLGFDTTSPVQTYTTTGTFISNFGQASATGSALDGAGHVWTVAPNFGSNTVKEYDASQTELNSFVATVNGNWIEDMAWGGSNTIWASTYEGNVFNINATTGAVNSNFSVANSSYTGVAFDGTNLWVSGGLTSNNIFEYSTSGTLIQTIGTQFAVGGLGYDSADNTLWAGGQSGNVYHLDLSGNVLSSFVAGSVYHDGLSVGNLGAENSVPEPGTLLLMGAGLIGLAAQRRKTRRA